MATIEVRGSNVLTVTGEEVAELDPVNNDYRTLLRGLLLNVGASESPVRSGTHDMWITYYVPATLGGEYDYGDMTGTPRPLRGVVRMGRIPADTSEPSIAAHLRVMLQEVGHDWLVPGDLTFRVDGREVGFAADLTTVINEGRTPVDPPMLGRDGSHWSAYFQADGSPMDGQHWVDEGTDGQFRRWHNPGQDGPTIHPSGLDPVQLRGTFNDLDLVIMGLKEGAVAYPGTGGTASWLWPQLAAPLPYQAGLLVLTSPGEGFYFGYHQDHRTLAVVQTGGDAGITLASTTPTPALHPPFGYALRALRVGDRLVFQARPDATAGRRLAPEPRDLAGGPGLGRIPDLFEGFPADRPRLRLPSPDRLRLPGDKLSGAQGPWTTVGEVRLDRAPQAIGLILRRWDTASYAQVAFAGLEVRTMRGDLVDDDVHAFTSLPKPISAVGDSALGSEPRLHLPSPGTTATVRGRGVLLLAAPYGTAGSDGRVIVLEPAVHSQRVDRAPKVVLRAPSGDFAFGTSAMVLRTTFTPWAGGYAIDKDIWGRVGTIPVTRMRQSRFVKPREVSAGTKLRFAFILLAQDPATLTDALIDRVNVIRRYWDATLPAATGGALTSTSTL